MVVNHYTPSTLRNAKKDIINAGTSNDNVKIIPLIKNYKNPKFFPRKFEKWPDEFEITLVGGNLQIRRSDVKIGGWGETLLIDVEFEFDIDYKDREIRPQKIPKVIYQTFEEYDIPNGMYDSVQSWKNLNPEYEHYYYTEPDRI